MRNELKQRFINYVKINTQSDAKSKAHPSTKGQWDLAHYLMKELKELGFDQVELDEKYCYVYGTLPGNVEKDVPLIAFIAHMDTATEMSGENVQPQSFVYDGGTIRRGELVMSPEDFPDLISYVGEEIITTDGTTLLGADDKAGIAEIVTALNYLKNHPEIPRGTIKFIFTPDEEIGQGPDFFDIERVGADFAYTIDGGPIGELEYENFNAAFATVTFSGENIHPGRAKNIMINSTELAMEFHRMLPESERPEFTEGYEGFFHLMAIQGDVGHTVSEYIIRDHDRDAFEKKKSTMQSAVKFLEGKYGPRINLEIQDSYYNMKEVLKEHYEIVELAKEAMENVGIEPRIIPIRGGTDGSQLSFMGLPTPNIFTGGHQCHGKYEFIPLSSMEKAVEVILEINRLNVLKHKS